MEANHPNVSSEEKEGQNNNKINDATSLYLENINILLGSQEVLDKITTDPQQFKIVDIRSYEEHTGVISGYEEITAKGRPKGAIWGRDIDYYRIYNNNCKLSAKEYKSKIEQILPNLDDSTTICFFCGTGWRAAEVYLYYSEIGFTNVCLFNGWFEWSALLLPVEPLNSDNNKN